MTERDRTHDFGAMTDASGSLTPEDPDDEFVPAETRELSAPGASRGLTAAAHQRREVRRGESADEPGSLVPRDEATAPNDRDGGYGSEHGLAANDPAYRVEEHLPEQASRPPAPGGEATMGGDARRDPEDERF